MLAFSDEIFPWSGILVTTNLYGANRETSNSGEILIFGSKTKAYTALIKEANMAMQKKTKKRFFFMAFVKIVVWQLHLYFCTI